MFVFLSKMLPQLVYPASMICLLLIIALIFCKSEKAKNRVLVLVIILLLVLGNKLPGAFLARNLENTYTPYNGKEKAGAIVVLGGGTESKGFPRQTVEINAGGDRILYGSELFLEGKSDLLLVGGSYIDWLNGETIVENRVSSPASEMAEIAEKLGVPNENILIQDRSLNTYQEAVEDAALLKERGIEKIILVSSATHMRRAVPLFEKQGLTVIPAPCDYSFSDQQWQDYIKVSPESLYTFIIPSISNISSLEIAIKEYLGYFIYHLRGWL